MRLEDVNFGMDHTYQITKPGLEQGRKCHILGSYPHDGACLIAELWNAEGDDIAHPSELVLTEACYLEALPC